MGSIKNFVFFDFETTGVNPLNCLPIEFAAVRFIDGEAADSLSFLIKQNIQLPEKITEITGITQQEMESDGILEKEALHKIVEFLGDSLISAHNAAYDVQILNNLYMKYNLGHTVENGIIDTLTIARHHDFYPHKLEDLCQRHGIELDGAHRALNDVIGGGKLLMKYSEIMDTEIFINKIGYMIKYGPPAWKPPHCQFIGQNNKYDNSRRGYSAG